jgi:sugar lactone lactonase YvrE
MPRIKALRPILVPVALMTLFGCDLGSALSPIFGGGFEEVKVASKRDATEIVSVEDSLPKPPKYSPYLIDHGTLSPFSSPTPDPSPTPRRSPGSTEPSASPGPVPSGQQTGSPTPVPSPQGPATTFSGSYTATLLAGGSLGAPKDEKGAAAIIGANGVVGMAVDFTQATPLGLGFTDGSINQFRKALFADGAVSRISGDIDRTDNKDDNSFKRPGGAAFDAAAKLFYMSDTEHNRICSFDDVGNSLTWLAGPGNKAGIDANLAPTFKDGKGTAAPGGDTTGQATFKSPRGLAFKPSTKTLFVADSDFHCIRALDLSKNPCEVTTIAGAGGQKGKPADLKASEDATAARFDTPCALALSTDEKTLYVADTGNHLLRAIDLTNKKVTVLAGSGSAEGRDATGTAATFNRPSALAVDKSNLYVGEEGTPRLRVVSLTSAGAVTTALGLPGTGKEVGDKTKATFTKIMGLCVELDGNGNAKMIYAYDAGDATNGPRLVSIKPS